MSRSERMRNVAARTCAALVVGVAALALAVPAQAATSNCASGAACIWEDSGHVTNGIGANLVAFQNYIPNYTLWSYSSTTISANDSASSLYNNGNVSCAYFYQNASGTGWSIKFTRQSGSTNLTANGANDEISSGYFASC